MLNEGVVLFLREGGQEERGGNIAAQQGYLAERTVAQFGILILPYCTVHSLFNRNLGPN